MQNFTRSDRRRAFLRINIALSICALGFASLTMAYNAKKSLATGPKDGVCANMIGSANCPPDSTFAGMLPYTWYTCHQSSAWYDYGLPFPLGPYYNCCLYELQGRMCLDDYGAGYSFQYAEYFRLNTYKDASCRTDASEQGVHCIND